MPRKRIIKISFGALGLIVLLVGLYTFEFGSVSITAPMVAIPLFITRNGQEVPAGEIRSVQYFIDVNPPKSPEERHIPVLREASKNQDYYLLGAAFSIYRYDLPSRTEVKPDFRSVFLRISFADGKVVTVSFPILSDTRENLPMFVDLGDVQR